MYALESLNAYPEMAKSVGKPQTTTFGMRGSSSQECPGWWIPIWQYSAVLLQTKTNTFGFFHKKSFVEILATEFRYSSGVWGGSWWVKENGSLRGVLEEFFYPFHYDSNFRERMSESHDNASNYLEEKKQAFNNCLLASLEEDARPCLTYGNINNYLPQAGK